MTGFSVGLNSDGWRLLRGRLAFTGAAGFGAQGVHNIFTTTGIVEVFSFHIYSSESLVGATATFDIGVTGLETVWLAGVIATDMTAGSHADSTGAGPEGAGENVVAVPGYSPVSVSNNITMDVDTANITDGQLDFFIWWRPLSSNGNLVLATGMTAI